MLCSLRTAAAFTAMGEEVPSEEESVEIDDEKHEAGDAEQLSLFPDEQ